MIIGSSTVAKSTTCITKDLICNNLFRLAKVKKLNHLQALTVIKFKIIITWQE